MLTLSRIVDDRVLVTCVLVARPTPSGSAGEVFEGDIPSLYAVASGPLEHAQEPRGTLDLGGGILPAEPRFQSAPVSYLRWWVVWCRRPQSHGAS